jgi:polysaccharide biosynthesis protein PslH
MPNDSLRPQSGEAVILIANAAPWPPTNGATVRQYHQLLELRRRGLTVHIAAFCEDKFLAEAHRELAPLAHSVTLVSKNEAGGKLSLLSHALRGRPLTEGHYASQVLQKATIDFFKNYPKGRALVHSSNVACLVPKTFRNRSVLDMADLDSAKFVDLGRTESWPMSWVYGYEARVLAKAERAFMDEFAATVFVTPREIKEIDLPTQTRLAPKLHAIANGVDAAKFVQPEGAPDLSKLPPSERKFFAQGSRVLFTGVMDYLPNVQAAQHFVREIWPSVLARHGHARFTIMGARPTPAVLALETIPGVEVTGFVDDAVPYFQTASCVVIPLLVARGIQNKALEAMACSKAIVCYPDVAIGVQARDGVELFAPATPEAFAERVNALLASPTDAQAIGHAARSHIETQFVWTTLMRELIDLLPA